MDELDGLLADLNRVLDELAALPEDDFAGRFRLQEEQKRLRERAAELRRQAPVDRAALEAELEALMAQWESIQKQRIDVVMQSGGGSQGGDAFSGAFAVRVNQEIDAALGRDELEARIKEIQRVLAEDA